MRVAVNGYELKTLLVTARRGEIELEGDSISHSNWPVTRHVTPSIHPGPTAKPNLAR